MADANLIQHRKAVLTDAVPLWRLRRRSILELAPQGMSVDQAEAWAAKATIEDIEQRLRELEIWVAETDATIVGWVAIRGDYLEGLYTDPGFARQGIGTQLLDLAENLMRERGVSAVRAEASWNSEDFYVRRGYEPTGPRPPDGARPFVKRLAARKLDAAGSEQPSSAQAAGFK